MKKFLPLILAACAAIHTTQAALLIHYSFDSEATGPLASGAAVINTGSSGKDGTAGIPNGTITVLDDATGPSGASGLLGNYLNFQPGADGDEGTNATHITTGSPLDELGIGGTTDYTMAAWVKFDNQTGDNMIFGGNSGDVIHNGARASNYHGGHWGDDISSSGNPSTDIGKWHHVTWTNTGQTQEIFVDGISSSTGGAAGAGAFNNNLGEPLLIGTSRNGGSFRGCLDDVAVFSTTLNHFQIAAFHSLALHPDYGYDAAEIDQLITAYSSGVGGAVTLADTTWNFVNSDPLDGSFFVRLGAGGSGMVGSTGPAIRSFAADHIFIPTGTPITLSWDVGTDATSLTLDQGIGDVLAITTDGLGQIAIDPGPLVETTYLLSASNAVGTNTSELTVTVTDQPIIELFAASQIVVAPDTTVQLSWDVLNVDSLDLDGTDVTGTSRLDVAPDSTTTWTLTATNAQGTSTAQVTVMVVIPGEPVISEISAAKQDILDDEDGESSDWIEVSNLTALAAILHDYYLSDDPNNLTKWRIPDMTLGAQESIVIFASGKDRAVAGAELHTNFALRSGGEYLALSKIVGEQTTILSEFNPFPEQFANTTWGIFPDGVTRGYFTRPTPGEANSDGVAGIVRDTSFLPDRGFYEAPISVVISSATAGAQIRYTTDGTDPRLAGAALYSAPLAISTTTVLRAVANFPGYAPTNVDTHTYLFPADVLTQPKMRSSITQDATYGPQMLDSLKSGPTISLVTEHTAFENEGSANIRSEHQTSIEMIFADGTPGFQEDGGLSNYGGRFTNFPKKSFRVAFRSEFGTTKLKYPIFDGFDYKFFSPAEEFDVINLRSGSHDMAARGAYMSNRFTDDSMLDMGNIGPHGSFVHVYLNGKYWGQYHLRERWSADMASSYFGGPEADYDAVNANDNFIDDLEVYDGDGIFWNETLGLLAGADPFNNATDHIDAANIIDFMLLWVSGGSESEFRAFGSAAQGVPFKFMIKDADGFLNGPGHSANDAGPFSVMSRMRTGAGGPDFSILVADRIHKHFFNDGALTPANNIERLRRRVDERRLGFLSEAARWGDRFRDPPSWEAFQTNLINNQFPGLTQSMINRFRSAGMYPTTAAPVFSQHGGHISSTTQLGMSNDAGSVYFTTDGSDPRLPGGAINPTARGYGIANMTMTELVAAASVWKYLDDGSDQGTTWREPGFDDGAWVAGPGQLGYGDGDESTIVSYGPSSSSRFITTYFRKTINASDVAGFTSLCLELLHDDGAVVYLNGSELVRPNMPGGDIDHLTLAARSASGSTENLYAKFDIPTAALVEGENTLAVEIHQVTPSSSDLGFDLRLIGVHTDSAELLFLTDSGPLRARTLIGNSWSALNESSFVVDAELASSENLVVSEIHYRPLPPDAGEEEAGFLERSQFEFVEIMNIGSNDVDLTNVRFTEGISFDFDDAGIAYVLSPGRRIVVVNNLAAFQHRYPSVPREDIAGVYSGNLSNDGERLLLLAGDDSTIRDVAFNDQSPWPESADGAGFSLTLVAPAGNPDHSVPFNWRPSVRLHGSPADSDTTAFTGDPMADEDEDQIPALIEYFLGTSDASPSTDALPAADQRTLSIGGSDGDYLTLSFTMNLGADDVSYLIEISDDLNAWRSGPGEVEFFSRTNHGDGTATMVYRSADPVQVDSRTFMRLKATQR